MQVVDLKSILEEKMQNEIIQYKSNLMRKKPEEIIENAYKFIVLEEIEGQLNKMNFDQEQLRALINKKDLLLTFYNDWLCADGCMGEIIADTSIIKTLNKIEIQHYKKILKAQRESR